MSMARPTEAEITRTIIERTFYNVGKAYLVRDPAINAEVYTRFLWIDPIGNTEATKQLLMLEVTKVLGQLPPDSKRDIFDNDRVRVAFCESFAKELATTQHIFCADFAERAAGNLWYNKTSGMVRVYSERVKAKNMLEAAYRALSVLDREPIVVVCPVAIEIPVEFYCPIILDVMRDPVVCSDGNSYEAAAITEWFARGHTISPLSRENIEVFTFPNRNLKKLIDDHLEKLPVLQREALERAREALDYKVALEKFSQEYEEALQRLAAKSEGYGAGSMAVLPWTSARTSSSVTTALSLK